jgi:hypothetical protein
MSSLTPDSMPEFEGRPILDDQPRQAFRIDPEEIIFSIKQQFPTRELALREMTQNSVDAHAENIRAEFRYEDKRMIIEWADDGCGMDLPTLRDHYLVLFDSSKEDEETSIGYYCLGRISALCYNPTRIEVWTLAEGGSGYRLEIESDLSGRLYEVAPEALRQTLGFQHGTLIRLEVPVEDEAAFVEAVKKANESMDQETCWVEPKITATVADLNAEGQIEYQSRVINREFALPGKFAMNNLTVKLASRRGQAQVRIGLREAQNINPITLCKGRIPLERPNRLPWTGDDGTDDDGFMINGLCVLVDSYQFTTNIGRNRVYRDTPFFQELLPLLFREVILKRFVEPMAKFMAHPRFQPGENEPALLEMLAGVCIRADEYDFEIPPAVLQAPFIQDHYGPNLFSLAQLDEFDGAIFYTREKPTLYDLRSAQDAGDEVSPVVCVSLAALPWEFTTFLEERFAGRLHPKADAIYVDQTDTQAMVEITQLIRQRLRYKNLWSDFLQNLLDAKNVLPRGIRQLTAGRFVRFDGIDERRTPVLCQPKNGSAFVNMNHPHIQNIIEMFSDEQHHDFAAHLLIREMLFSPSLNLPASYREDLLTRDLIYRFGYDSDGGQVGPATIQGFLEAQAHLLAELEEEEFIEF